MRKLLFESVFRQPLTERAPSLNDAAVAELATALGQAAAGTSATSLDAPGTRRLLSAGRFDAGRQQRRCADAR